MLEKLPAPGRLLALDYGRVRVGIALSDALQITAQPYITLEKYKNFEHLAQLIKKLCTEKDVVGIIIGVPVNMDGTEGEMALEVKEFVAILSNEVKLPYLLIDERLTSKQAQRVLQQAGKKATRMEKGKLDQIAASFILTGYLDRKVF
ncbi:MAG: Holliday junction resolvase RuvX [Deferribacteres bacterium]|nr:Holliday junction resolvase RuvX [candidate division KSB1 bacterium]MCB9501483.1 Holliday junction resolvase RuvX [Deferribacteres bacterium]